MNEKGILFKLVVGAYGCNCYIVGSKKEKKIFIIDPGAEPEKLINHINKHNLDPKAIILTHAHPDHAAGARRLQRHYKIPLWFNQKDYKKLIFKKADRWLKEGDILETGEIKYYILETGGHSPGGISIYTHDIHIFREKMYDGIIFTGDLIFRRSKGRTDLNLGNEDLLFKNIKNKIMYHPKLSENFLILAGHMGITTIKEEKQLNPFGKFFLSKKDWKNNYYYGKKLKTIFQLPAKDRK